VNKQEMRDWIWELEQKIKELDVRESVLDYDRDYGTIKWLQGQRDAYNTVLRSLKGIS